MELLFSHTTATKFTKTGHYGRQIAAKERTGQRPNVLVKTFTVTLPDKVNKDWYVTLEQKLQGVKLQSLKHVIKLKDNTDFLQAGYNALLKEQGGDYLTLLINPMQEGFITQVGRAIINMKGIAKQKINKL